MRGPSQTNREVLKGCLVEHSRRILFAVLDNSRKGIFGLTARKMDRQPKIERGGREKGRKETLPFFPTPLCSFTCAIFARALTFVPRSLLPNRTEKLATQADLATKAFSNPRPIWDRK